MMFLNELKPGMKAKVKEICIENEMLCRRLMDMGIAEDAEILITCKAPLGGPVALECANQSICIRRNDAACIQVERV